MIGPRYFETMFHYLFIYIYVCGNFFPPTQIFAKPVPILGKREPTTYLLRPLLVRVLEILDILGKSNPSSNHPKDAVEWDFQQS